MKKVIVLSVFILSGLCGFTQGVEFVHNSFEEVLAKAKAENKMVFVDCYTIWCGPCKLLAKDIFPQEKVGRYFNENFVSLKLDMEKGEGPELNKKYEVKAYPTLLFLDSDGKLVETHLGFIKGDALVDKASAIINARRKQ